MYTLSTLLSFGHSHKRECEWNEKVTKKKRRKKGRKRERRKENKFSI